MLPIFKTVSVPYLPGDVLWVRETWQEVYETEYFYSEDGGPRGIQSIITNFDDISHIEAGLSTNEGPAGIKPRMKYYVFRADGLKYSAAFSKGKRLKWRPSIFMPREAARLFLRVKDARVERLREIDDEGAKAEGANYGVGVEEKMRWSAIDRFAVIWDGTIKPAERGAKGWDADPWVWVIKYERTEKPEGWST